MTENEKACWEQKWLSPVTITLTEVGRDVRGGMLWVFESQLLRELSVHPSIVSEEP